jgi:hypothetical protein
MTGRRAPVERLVDLAVAIPVSVAVAARQLVPVGVTRLERRIARDLTLLQRYARRAAPSAHTSSTTPEVPPVTPAPTVAARAEVDERPVGAPAAAGVEIEVEVEVDVETVLPIEGYDQLSARHIVDRLPSLTADELAVVEAHERAGRRRQTVLARIAQLA